MRVALTLSFVVNLLVAFVSALVLPERVAIHFAWSGAADGWAARLDSVLLTLALDTLLFLTFWLSPAWLRRTPVHWVNLPNRTYWLSPERREATIARFSQRLWAFGTALFLFLLAVGLLTLAANLADPVRLDQPLFLAALGIFLAYTLYWTVALIRDFRLPTDSGT
ncbi:DUF1648 domain-containing protein [Thiorhodococcus minor]|uniref:DUF1648 domain-containing protein n=1 Tax=Thiorhodococcus minor TaxID=57489 RepID=A0A6M0JS51_9GAMM|nr:DUF1648 domain-containing protein [Thiorhodococcus minor]NEV60352.1 DUF1648 domain-containing protein [Thiorhodococcus minor]